MSSLLALLSQQSPNLQTRKGLILTGLQNDFLSPTGKLPVDTSSGFVERLKDLAIEFRSYGEIIWVRSEFEATRRPSEIDEDGCNVITAPTMTGQRVAGDAIEEDTSGSDSPRSSRKRKAGDGSSSDARSSSKGRHSKRTPSAAGSDAIQRPESDADEELFLTRTATREPCCVKGSVGAQYAEQIKNLVRPNDLQVVKTYYSAFSSTSLLLTLRSKLITELYVAGCTTNLSVYATAMDAARYGIKIILVQDCLGYRKRDRHNLAIERLVDIMEAKVMTAEKALERLRNPFESDDEDEASDEDDEIPLGASAAHIQPSAALEVDSDDRDDEDDDEMDLPTVRTSLALRSSRPEHSDSSKAVTGARSAPEHSQSSRTPPAKSSSSLFVHPGHDSNVARENASTSTDLERRNSTPPAGHSGMKDLQTVKNHTATQRETSIQEASSAEQRSIALSYSAKQDSDWDNHQSDRLTHRVRSANQKPTVIERPRELPLLGDENKQESAGSRILYDLLPPDSSDGLFHRLKGEVKWQTMRHLTGEVPRLVCCQGTLDEVGSMPVYRHPSDETLPLLAWTSTVDQVRIAAEKVVGHELNHALIQLYRGGTDFISEHSDKTLDIAHGSSIVNVSFGAERVMRLRTKRGASSSRTTYRVRLPHNSALIMSLDTNARFLHGINPDKRMQSELTAAEKAYEGQRISLTFRRIGTFLSPDEKLIWGQGAVEKSKDDAQPVVNGDKDASEWLVRAFGMENQASMIAWEEWYGEGSDVLHLKSG